MINLFIDFDKVNDYSMGISSRIISMHSEAFFKEVEAISKAIDVDCIERLAKEILSIRNANGRLFILGVGGSAGNAGHAVNDFRKLCGIETYAPTDNVSELTARTNDEGFETIFSEWLKVSKLGANDGLLIYSVGGGNKEKNVSVSLINAIDLAKERGAKVLGIVGKDNGYTVQAGDEVVVVPIVNPDRVTPLSEAFQGVVWHCLVSHPILQVNATKW